MRVRDGQSMVGSETTRPDDGVLDAADVRAALAAHPTRARDHAEFASMCSLSRTDEPTPRRKVLVGAAACGAAYLYGSLPVVYLLGTRRALDLRQVGSGNVGATNLMAGGGRVLSLLGWVFDASKGSVPIAACRRLGLSEAVAALAGVCGVAGQCWPVFLGFRGGRGISAFVGASALLTDAPGWALTLAPLAGGGLFRVLALRFFSSGQGHARSRSVPFGCFLGVVAFPLIVSWRQSRGGRARKRGENSATREHGTVLASSLLSAIILLRRLTAPLPDDAVAGPPLHPEAWLYRLLFDRNTSE